MIKMVPGDLYQPTEGVIANRARTQRELSQRKLRLRAEPDPEPSRIPPTPQTAAKRRRDSVQVMYERDMIGDEEVRAALEIRRVYHAIVGSLFARAQDPSRMNVRTSPSSAWPACSTNAFERYRDWAQEFSDKLVRGGPPVLEVCIDAIVDGMTCAEVDAARRWRKGRAADLVREGLERYALRAGWRVAAAA